MSKLYKLYIYYNVFGVLKNNNYYQYHDPFSIQHRNSTVKCWLLTLAEAYTVRIMLCEPTVYFAYVHDNIIFTKNSFYLVQNWGLNLPFKNSAVGTAINVTTTAAPNIPRITLAKPIFKDESKINKYINKCVRVNGYMPFL